MKKQKIFDDEYYMSAALEMAQMAYKKQEVPVGCVIVQNGKIIGKGYNKKEHKKCSVFHAEIVAIENACKKIHDWRLFDATLFVTMEPCVMCAGAIVNHRIKKVVIGAMEHNFGACGSGLNILQNEKLNTNIDIKSGVCEEKCRQLLQKFFEERRNK